jgi:LEA14-like dessication related protein
MRKLFFYGGIGIIGYAFYSYFRKQYDLAVNYTYRLKNIKVLELTKEKATLDCTVEIKNKSSFQVEIRGWDLVFKYKGVEFADTKSNETFAIPPDSEFSVSAVGDLDFKNYKSVLYPAVLDIVSRKPIDIEVDGKLFVTFMGINRTINFSNEEFRYSDDIIEEVGLGKKYDKTLAKIQDIFGKIGVKV